MLSQDLEPVIRLGGSHELLQRAEEHAPHDPCRLSGVAFTVDRIDDGVEQLGAHGLNGAREGEVVEVAGKDVDDASELR
jgi:hypothetical protein